MWSDPPQSHNSLSLMPEPRLAALHTPPPCRAAVPGGRALLIRSELSYATRNHHLRHQDHLYILLFLHPRTPPEKKSAFLSEQSSPALPFRQNSYIPWGDRSSYPFLPLEGKKRQRCIINHANCLLQHCQENDHPHSNHQYSWHLSKSAGHAYPSAFKEVSMCKHPFTIFRVMLKLFITYLSVLPICHIVLIYQCLLLVISFLHCVFRALGYRMFLKLSNI